jgi:hypothetical protein
MFVVGQIVHLKQFPESATLVVLAVSPFIDMVRIDGGWCWADHLEPVNAAIDEQLQFLGLTTE